MYRKVLWGCLVGCFSFNSLWVFAEQVSQDQSVQVEGEILPYKEPTLINLTLPSEMTFKIDPNEASGQYFVSSEFLIDNLSDIPLSVSVKAFQSVQGKGIHQFQDVLPTAHENWLGLGVEETMRDFALGVKIVNPDQWSGAVRTETLWVKEVQESPQPIVLGSIPAQTQGVGLTLEAKHGLKFSQGIRPSYDLTLYFEYK